MLPVKATRRFLRLPLPRPSVSVPAALDKFTAVAGLAAISCSRVVASACGRPSVFRLLMKIGRVALALVLACNLLPTGKRVVPRALTSAETGDPALKILAGEVCCWLITSAISWSATLLSTL